MYWKCSDYRRNTRPLICTRWWKSAVCFVHQKVEAAPVLKNFPNTLRRLQTNQSRCCEAGSSFLESSVTVAATPLCKQPLGTMAQIDSMFNRSPRQKRDAVGDLLLRHEKLMKHTAKPSELWINYREQCIILTTEAATPVVQYGRTGSMHEPVKSLNSCDITQNLQTDQNWRNPD